MITILRECDKCHRTQAEHQCQGWARVFVEIYPTQRAAGQGGITFDLCPPCVKTSDLTAMLRGRED